MRAPIWFGLVCHPVHFVRLLFLAFLGLILGGASGVGADFTVTLASSSSYAINGSGNNPTITVVRGQTYTFFVNNTTASHPFRIISPAGTTTNNNISSGTITFKVPTNALNYTYDCSIHHFGGQIVTVAPPVVRIIRLSVSTNIVVTSLGTNNWTVMPEFKTNMGSTSWMPLTVQTNRYLTGTNVTVCARPPDNNIFIRIKTLHN